MQSFSLVPAIKNISNRTSNNFFLIAGPCAIESEKMALDIAEVVKRITTDYWFLNETSEAYHLIDYITIDKSDIVNLLKKSPKFCYCKNNGFQPHTCLSKFL